nr:putative retrotransposon Ty1-copia subclass protein [Tanacetum cinerariifolium]
MSIEEGSFDIHLPNLIVIKRSYGYKNPNSSNVCNRRKVDLPPDGKTAGSKWLFKKKTRIDGAVHTFKARLVAKGFTQNYGVNYEETFSSVANIRAIRILIAVAAFYDYEIWQMDEHELGDLGEPTNYKATLLDPESKKWIDAMNVEMQYMKDNDVWVLVELPPNARTVGSKWLFKKKTDMDGALYIFKARLVAKGFTQTLEL